MTTPLILAAHINEFAVNLDNSITMEDRRFAVTVLAKKVGATKANEIAELFGLTSNYYKSN